MIRALYTAASGMSAQQANLDTVANNLANSATSGFRRRRASVRGHDLPEYGDAGRGAEPANGVGGAADRAWNAVGGYGSDHDAGRLQPDGEHPGPGDPGSGIFPGFAAPMGRRRIRGRGTST